VCMGVLWCSGKTPTRSSPRQRVGKQPEVKQEQPSPLATSKGVAAEKCDASEEGARKIQETREMREMRRLARLVAIAASTPLPDDEDP
jgi:hypothetical protein